MNSALIEPSPTAPEGSVRELPSYAPTDFPPNSAILCRTNAPLISFAFDLLRRQIACHVKGRDFATGLTALIDKMKAVSVRDLQDHLNDYELAQTNKLRRKGREQEAENLADKIQCLLLFTHGCASIPAVKEKITNLFKDGPGVCLATVHKAKGLEWETVFILDFHLMPSEWARGEWELEQEHHLIYVAQTRAKLNLIYIKSNKWTTNN